MGESRKAGGRSEPRSKKADLAHELKIASSYLEHKAFQGQADNLQTKYLHRVVEILKEGRKVLEVDDFSGLHPLAKGDLTHNVQTEISKLRKRIERVARELGLPKISLTALAGQEGTYGITLGNYPFLAANRVDLFRVQSQFWSRVVAMGGPPLVIVMTVALFAVFVVWSRSDTVWTVVSSVLMILILICLVLIAVPLSGLLDHKFRVLWPTLLYLKLDDRGLRVERIWLDCPICAAAESRGMMIPAHDRRRRKWMLRCQSDPEHAAVFHPMTYRVDLSSD